MDNDWCKIVLCTVAFFALAAVGLGLIAFMLYIPEFFK